jgi:hypothetical protein
MIKEFSKYNFLDFIKSLGINYNDFDLYPDYFNHKSDQHGVNHTFRVMFNCLMIGNEIQDKLNTKRAFMSSYIHDMARKHDYTCSEHGRHAVKEKLPIYKDIFIKNGLDEEDIEAIKLAVSNHSEEHEISKSNPFYKTVAILRDADGLDLPRIDVNVRPDILRFKESIGLIDKAEDLFNKTEFKKYTKFTEFLKDNI